MLFQTHLALSGQLVPKRSSKYFHHLFICELKTFILHNEKIGDCTSACISLYFIPEEKQNVDPCPPKKVACNSSTARAVETLRNPLFASKYDVTDSVMSEIYYWKYFVVSASEPKVGSLFSRHTFS